MTIDRMPGSVNPISASPARVPRAAKVGRDSVNTVPEWARPLARKVGNLPLLTPVLLGHLQRAVGNSATALVVACQRQTQQRAAPDTEVGRTLLPVAAGARSYEVAIVRRAGHMLVAVSLTGGRDRFEVPLPQEDGSASTVAFPEREVQPDRSTLAILATTRGRAARSYRVEVIPSPHYTTAETSIRPDRVNVSSGAGEVGKDVYPSGSPHRLSNLTDTIFSTAVNLPPSGHATEPATVVVEVAPGAGGRGGLLVLNLQKTGQLVRLPIVGADVMSGTVRLAGRERAPQDRFGNPREHMLVECIDAAGRTVRVLDMTFTSWRDAGARDEGYTYRVVGLTPGGEERTHGFVIPPESGSEFHVRTLTDRPGLRETLSGSQEYNAQISTASAGGMRLRFGRSDPAGAVQVWLTLTGADSDRHFTVDYPLPTFRLRVIEDTGGPQGRLALSFDGTDRRHLMVGWGLQELREEVPFLESFSHIILRRVATTRVDLVVSGAGIETFTERWYAPPLPDDAIMPPKWRQVQIQEVGWLEQRGHRFVPRRIIDAQVGGIRVAQLLMQRYAIEYIHVIPVVGELVMLGEAISGREIISGRRLDPSERALMGLFAGLGTVLTAASSLRGTSGAARTARLTEVAGQLGHASGLTEREARALVEAGEHVSAEDRAFLQQMEADVRAGRTVDAARMGRLRTIVTNVDRRQVLDVLEARIQQIRGARGDPNVFRARFRALAGASGAQDLTGVARKLDELLTSYRRVRVVTGGGRSGGGVSTYIESLDGEFSVRITHNQVGPNPVGQPPYPRIHIYEGSVSGHGRHIVLPTGTTLQDILRALGL